MDPVRQFVARKQSQRVPLHIILTTTADAMGALKALKPLLPEDPITGVFYAIDTRKVPAYYPKAYGPDGREIMVYSPGSKTPKVDFEKFLAGDFTGRMPKPGDKAPISMLNAWFLAEGFDYSKLSGLKDKTGDTAAADLKAAAVAELHKRRDTLGDPDKAGIVAWQSLQRLAMQMEKFEPTKEEGKELRAKVKARGDDPAFKSEVTAYTALHSLDASVCSQRKVEMDKAKAGYEEISSKFANTYAGTLATQLLESIKPKKAP